MARRTQTTPPDTSNDTTTEPTTAVKRSTAAKIRAETPAKTVAAATSAAAATIATTPEATPGAAPIRRRRRRRTVDHGAQTGVLVASLLSSRKAAGATRAQVEKVVLWARGVHAEAAELATLAKRPRLRKAEISTDRQATLDLNKALLDAVMAGKLAVDVNESGEIVFLGGGTEVAGG